ncbi:alpha/beta fold hydrolase [Planktotalea arctica]|uniref:alpha/beta fold hydrolase n=1 Tax=Planktotalea arctica TaxID=1481893 RepID=UPI001FE39CC2|nr:alpha/beta hydrolase [Planktotalea arctica]
MSRLVLKFALYAALFLAVFAALTWWRAAAREAASEAGYPPEGQFIEVNGHRVHAVVRGSGPDLVLIHGASGSTRDYTFSLLDKLKSDYRVIVLDRPGLGYTPRLHERGESLAEQAALLSGAALHLGAKNPIVLGQSFGGAVALAWAVHHPENIAALVLLAAPSNLWTTPVDRLYRATSSRLGAKLFVPLLTAWVPNSYVAGALEEIFEPQDEPAGYAEYFGPGITLRRETMIANARQRVRLLDDIKALIPRYGQIAVPTQLVHGDTDTIVGLSIHSALLVDQIQDAQLSVLQGVGHMPQHVSQPEVIAAIERAARGAGLR